MRIRRFALPITLLALLLVLGGWGKGRQKKADLDYWHDRAKEFTGLQTFDWQPADRLLSKNESALDRWIVESVERELSEHGIRQDDGAEVDFVIAYEYTAPDRARDTSRPAVSNCRRGKCQRANPQAPSVELDNTLYFEFQDPVTRLPFWRGKIRPVLGRGADLEDDFVTAIRDIMSQYPPS